MKRPATSLTIACANVLLVGISFFQKMTRIGCCALGSPANVIAMVIVPAVVLLTLVFIVKDLLQPSTRFQALFAVILFLPVAWFVSSIHLA